MSGEGERDEDGAGREIEDAMQVNKDANGCMYWQQENEVDRWHEDVRVGLRGAMREDSLLLLLLVVVDEERRVDVGVAGRDTALVAARCLRPEQVTALPAHNHAIVAVRENCRVDAQLGDGGEHAHFAISHDWDVRVDARHDPLHENERLETDALAQRLVQLLAVQVVTSSLALRLEHEGVRLGDRLSDDCRQAGIQESSSRVSQIHTHT